VPTVGHGRQADLIMGHPLVIDSKQVIAKYSEKEQKGAVGITFTAPFGCFGYKNIWVWGDRWVACFVKLVRQSVYKFRASNHCSMIVCIDNSDLRI
jgi:hypothetical protein